MAHDFQIGKYDPCPCGSGKKYKFCCAGKSKEDSHGKFPIGTVAFYGPDDKTTTKIAAGVMQREESPMILERWIGPNVADDPEVGSQIKQFFARHGVKTVTMSDGNMGCPHEEGIDFPRGEDCPLCPFWAGKQGTGRRDLDDDKAVLAEAIDDLWTDDDEDDEIDSELDDLWTEDEDDEEIDDEFDDGAGDEDDGEPAEDERDWDAAFARVEAILGKGHETFDDSVAALAAHLKANLSLPCEVTGIEDFRWEEPYIFGGFDPREYRRLKKTQPSYTDRYQLLDIEYGDWSEWMMFHDEDIGAHVRRISDGKEFILGLAELEATDKSSANYQMLDDYVAWFVNNR